MGGVEGVGGGGVGGGGEGGGGKGERGKRERGKGKGNHNKEREVSLEPKILSTSVGTDRTKKTHI